MTIVLTTLQSKNGAKLTPSEFDTNFKTIQDTLNDTLARLEGIVGKLEATDKTLNYLTSRINSQELTISAIKVELQKESTSIDGLFSLLHKTQSTTIPVQLKTLQGQVASLSSSVESISLELKGKVSTSVYNSQISALNTAIVNRQ